MVHISEDALSDCRASFAAKGRTMKLGIWSALGCAALMACGSSTSSSNGNDGGAASALDAGTDSGWSTIPMGDDEPPTDASKPVDDAGGYPLCDGGTMPTDDFVTRVVSFTPGACAGFGASLMPAVVLGPPVGRGDSAGGLDVVSLGTGGTIVVSFAPNAIVDGPGDDFIVFENAFDISGNAQNPNAEIAEVSVSDDGTTWTPFPCTATAFPYGACAGWHPVESSPSDCISPRDPATAGGDAYDLSNIGVAHASFVKIVDKGSEACSSDPSQQLNTNGFDLDAIAVVNGAN
jgi:hypothetical protein